MIGCKISNRFRCVISKTAWTTVSAYLQVVSNRGRYPRRIVEPQRQRAHCRVIMKNSFLVVKCRMDLNMVCTSTSDLRNQGQQTLHEVREPPWVRLVVLARQLGQMLTVELALAHQRQRLIDRRQKWRVYAGQILTLVDQLSRHLT